MNARRLFSFAHGWLGTLSSGFIFLIAGSGALLAFMGELFLLQHGDMLRALPQAGQPYAPATHLITSATDGYGKTFRTMGVLMPRSRVEEVETALVFGLPEGADSVDELMMLSVDPWSGQYKGSFYLNQTFGHELIDFHHGLLIGDVGILIVSVIAILLVLMAFSGLWLWIPKKSLQWSQKPFKADSSGSLIKVLFSWHSLFGFWLSLLVIYFAITGLGVSKPDWFGGLVTPVPHAPSKQQLFNQQCHQSLPLEQILSTANQQFPNDNLAILFLPNQPNGPYMLNYMTGKDLNKREGDKRIFVHSSCDNIYQTIDLANSDTPTRLAGQMLSLHAGYSFKGVVGDILVVITGLGLMLLSVSGLYVFIARRT